MTDAKQPIFFLTYIGLTIVYTVLQSVHSSGYFELRLKSYERDINNTCCDGFDAATSACKPCDHFIFVCLLDGRDHGHGPCVSNNVTTQPVNDTNNITFGAKLGAETNPFKLKFNIPSGFLTLLFSIYDDDMYDTPSSEPDLLENMTYTVYVLAPQQFSSSPSFSSGDISDNSNRVVFEYILQCDTDYYSKCEKYCHPDPIRYNCNSNGRRVCNDGWTGSNCTTFNYCWNQTCLNGGTCTSLSTKYSCKCNVNFTGSLCEILVKKAKKSTTANVANSQHHSDMWMTTPTLSSSNLDATISTSKDPKSTMTGASTILSLLPTITTAAIPTSTSLSTYAKPSTTNISVQTTTSPTYKLSSTIISSKTHKSSNTVAFQRSVMSTKITKPSVKTLSLLLTDATLNTRMHISYHIRSPFSHQLKPTSSKNQGGTGNKPKHQPAKTNSTFPKMVAILGGSSVGLLMLVGTVLYCIMRMQKRRKVNDRTEKSAVIQDECSNADNNVSVYNDNIDW